MEKFTPQKTESSPAQSAAESQLAKVKSNPRLEENVYLSFVDGGTRSLSPIENSLAMIEARVWEKSLAMTDREGGRPKLEEYKFLTERYLKEFGKTYEPIIRSKAQAEEFMEKYLKNGYRQEDPGEHTPEEVIEQLEQKSEKVAPETVFAKAL